MNICLKLRQFFLNCKLGTLSSHLKFKNLNLLSDFDEILYRTSSYKCYLKIKTKIRKKNCKLWSLSLPHKIFIYYPKSLYLIENEGKIEKNSKLRSLSPQLKFQNLHLLSDFDKILYETSLLKTIITVAPQLPAVPVSKIFSSTFPRRVKLFFSRK